MLLPRALAAAAAVGLIIAPAAAMEAKAAYIITLGGANIALVDVILDDDGARYSIGLDADVTGLGHLVASGTAKIDAAGVIGSRGLVSEKFDLHTVANGEDFDVKVQFANADVSAFVVTPPALDTYDRVPLERAHLNNVTDMISAFIIKGGSLDASLCDHDAKIFTGMERFDIKMGFTGEDTATSVRTGYQGPVILCNVRYTPVSGHYESSEMTSYLADNERILVWYAPLGETGYFIPYRVLMSTAFGDLSMVLTLMQD